MATMTTKEQYKLLKHISDTLCGIFDGISDEFDEDSENLDAITEVEDAIGKLLDAYEAELYEKKEEEPYTSYKNFVVLRDKEDGEITVKAYEDEDVMMRDVSKVICFSDCDDMWDIIKIVYHGCEVKYAGWRPCMEYKYYYTDNGLTAWKSSFPQWDH